MKTVSEYMSSHVVYLRAGDRVELARQPMLDFGLTAVPILDETHTALGLVSLPDERVRIIRPTTTLEEAAKTMIDANLHHLVVVDEHQKTVGLLSTLDVLRGLVGAPPKHPPSITKFIAASSGQADDLQSEYRTE